MPTITVQEAAYFSVPAPSCGIVVKSRVHDQLFGLIPFVYIDGDKLKIASVTGAGLESHASMIVGTGGSPPATFPTVDLAESPLFHFASILEVDSLVVSHYGNRRDILKALIDVKVASVLELFRKQLVTGTTGGFEGLLMRGNANKITANGGAGGEVQPGEIESTLSLLSADDNLSNRYLVMHAKALKHLRGGAYQGDISLMQHPDLGNLPVIAQVPVLINNYLPTNEPGDRTSILAVVLEPLTGLFGVLACAHRGREIRVFGPVPREGTDKLTFHVQMQAGARLAHDQSVAKLDGVQW